jgi:RimJ/RimL family protein N-acetyltransferase
MTADTLPRCEPIETGRLRLSPMSVEDADDLFAILDDIRLHRFIGGRPDTRDELTARLQGWSTQRSPDGNEAWCNWVVRTIDATVIGTVQATVWRPRSGADMHASLAWVVGWDHQGQGYASEAARGLAGWLRGLGVRALEASIHSGHEASQGVARTIGLQPTSEVIDGELVWRSVELTSDAG